MNYYLWINDAEQGPYDIEQIRAAVADGTIDTQATARTEDSGEWKPLSQIARLNTPKPSAPTPRTSAKPAPSIKKYLFIAPVLKHISEGRLFSRVFTIAIRIFAALIALGGIVGWIKAWRLVGDLHGFGVLGGVVFQLLFLVAIYMITHVLIIRASDIARLPVSEFTVIPIVSIFFRTLGEVYACLISALGVGGCIFLLFAGDNAGGSRLFDRAMTYMPGIDIVGYLVYSFDHGADSSFVAAILFLLSSALSAFFALVFFYLLAEGTVVFVDIARNIRSVRDALQTQPPAKDETRSA